MFGEIVPSVASLTAVSHPRSSSGATCGAPAFADASCLLLFPALYTTTPPFSTYFFTSTLHADSGEVTEVSVPFATASVIDSWPPRLMFVSCTS